MIIHQPYGNDDPYKHLPSERFPRDPQPGDNVRIGFQTSEEVERAWIVVRGDEQDANAESGTQSSGSEQEYCLPATSLREGRWTVDMGVVQRGRYSYRIHAEANGQEMRSEQYEFDVGHWVEVTGIAQLETEDGREIQAEIETSTLTIYLTTTAAPARMVITFPRAGVCRQELLVGGDDGHWAAEATSTDSSNSATGLPFRVAREGPQVRISGPGAQVLIDSQSLAFTATHASRDLPGFRGTLRSSWLVDSSARVSRLRSMFETGRDEWLYGLGERFTDSNRNGQEWDVRVYEEYQEQEKRTYLPIPFLLSTHNYGLWLDSNEPSYFDLRGTESSITREILPTTFASFPLHIIVAQRAYEVTATFTALTGEISVPPKWAFGPWMSANTWNDQARTQEVIERTVAEEVPATVLVLEAWSDESTFYIWNDAKYQPKPNGEPLSLGDFEFSGRWPNPKALIDFCHRHGIRVVLWQIPVQKKLFEPHEQHDLDEAHMLEKGYYIRNEDGTPYRNKGWWFSDALIVDFTNPEARDWWFSKRRYLFDELGIDGMKTDGGEHLWGRDLRAFDGRRGLELFNSYANSYVGAYHDFIRAATGDDGVTFSRAGYTGAQKWPCHWAGDEGSTWKAYRASIQAGLSAGLSGISMWAWDIAGFSGEIPSPELYVRATQMAAFCPLMQYHSEPHGASECRDRTPWNIAERHDDPSVLAIYRRYSQLRMRLLDYLYGEAQALSANGLPLMRYPALEYPAQHEYLTGDPYTYLLGRDLLVAPVVEKGVGTRDVRLPDGEWLDFWSGARFTGGRTVTVPAPLDRIPVFVIAESPRAQALLAAATTYDAGNASAGPAKEE